MTKYLSVCGWIFKFFSTPRAKSIAKDKIILYWIVSEVVLLFKLFFRDVLPSFDEDSIECSELNVSVKLVHLAGRWFSFDVLVLSAVHISISLQLAF